MVQEQLAGVLRDMVNTLGASEPDAGLHAHRSSDAEASFR
jgi:hypothetical protein